MKNVLKLSATALVIAGANMLFSQSALACSSTDFECQQRQQRQWQLQNDPNYCHYGYNPNCGNNRGGYYGGKISNYLGMAWTKDGKPYFYHQSVQNFSSVHFEEYDTRTVNKCNLASRRSPCRFATSLANGCIAISKSDSTMYALTGTNCNEAKQNAMQYCQAHDSNPNACKIHKAQRSAGTL